MSRLRLFVLSFLMFSSSEAFAITLDGNASDWFSNSNGAYAGWTPTAEVDAWANHDSQFVTIFPNADNNPYDIEMGAMSVATDGLYMMLVLSDERVWEDLAISVNGSPTHEYGVDLSSVANQMGVVQDRNTYQVTEWQTSHAGYTGLPDFNIVSGTFLGYSQFIISSIGIRDGYGTNDFLLEGFIPWASIGGTPESVCIQFSEISCLRDSFGLCTSVSTEVPEPASALLLLSGVLGMAGFKKRKLIEA